MKQLIAALIWVSIGSINMISHAGVKNDSGLASFWSSEAELGTLSGTAEVKQGCANASDEKFVKLGNSNGNSLTFENILMDQAGTYQLLLDYFYVGASSMNIIINDVNLGNFSFEPAVWCYQGPAKQFSLNVELNQGTNNLRFEVANSKGAPFLDKLQISDPSLIKLSITSTMEKLVPGQNSVLTVDASQAVSEDTEVSLSIGGVDAGDYRLSATSLTIPAGASSITANFEALLNKKTENITAEISISTSNNNAVIGDPGMLEIVIVNEMIVYYVSSSEGDDNNTGKSEDRPWKTLSKVNQTDLNPGDKVLFKSGDTFGGQLILNDSGTKNNPIVLSRYGSGAKPIIDGANEAGGAYLTAILINNASHIEISHLEITNDRKVSRSGVSNALGYGIYVHNDGDAIMNNLSFKHLTIRDVFAVNMEGVEFNSNKVSAIALRSEKNIKAGKEKHIRDVLVDSCYITRTGRFGIYTSHGGGDEGIGNDSINRNMNLVFRNNHFYQTGGSCITPGRSYNCLLENNSFDYPGSDADPRMANRGSGAWFWSCQNVIAQYNKSYHVRGQGDSYGMHIDFGNKNVILQYNYSEDSEGGFVEILGKNINSTYRFNVSVNDGIRDKHGNSIWVSDFAGSNSRIKSDSNYIYNNTIYVDANITPDVLVVGENTFIYNNIFYATGAGKIGESVTVDIGRDSQLKMSNNLFFGNISDQLINLDENTVFGNPGFENVGALRANAYQITNKRSPVLNAGISFPEPQFPEAGKGIFKDVKRVPEHDLFGNSVSIVSKAPNIGADNGDPNFTGINSSIREQNHPLEIYPNPVKGVLHFSLKQKDTEKLEIEITNLKGQDVLGLNGVKSTKENHHDIFLPSDIRNGIFILKVQTSGLCYSKSFVLYRN